MFVLVIESVFVSERQREEHIERVEESETERVKIDQCAFCVCEMEKNGCVIGRVCV